MELKFYLNKKSNMFRQKIIRVTFNENYAGEGVYTNIF